MYKSIGKAVELCSMFRSDDPLEVRDSVTPETVYRSDIWAGKWGGVSVHQSFSRHSIHRSNHSYNQKTIKGFVIFYSWKPLAISLVAHLVTFLSTCSNSFLLSWHHVITLGCCPGTIAAVLAPCTKSWRQSWHHLVIPCCCPGIL